MKLVCDENQQLKDAKLKDDRQMEMIKFKGHTQAQGRQVAANAVSSFSKCDKRHEVTGEPNNVERSELTHSGIVLEESIVHDLSYRIEKKRLFLKLIGRKGS